MNNTEVNFLVKLANTVTVMIVDGDDLAKRSV